MRFRPFDLFPYPFGANASFIFLIVFKINKKSNNDKGYVKKYAKDRLPVNPNPDVKSTEKMYLKRPSKKPQVLFRPHTSGWSIPEDLAKLYSKNNRK